MVTNAILHFPDDGEHKGISQNVVVFLPNKSKFKDSFCLTWGNGFMFLTKMGLTAAQYNILLIIIAQMEYENYCYVTQSYLTQETGMSQSNVSKNIKKLVDLNLLFKEKTKKGRAFRVNCLIAWKGNKDIAFSRAFSKDSNYFTV